MTVVIKNDNTTIIANNANIVQPSADVGMVSPEDLNALVRYRRRVKFLQRSWWIIVALVFVTTFIEGLLIGFGVIEHHWIIVIFFAVVVVAICAPQVVIFIMYRWQVKQPMRVAHNLDVEINEDGVYNLWPRHDLTLVINMDDTPHTLRFISPQTTECLL